MTSWTPADTITWRPLEISMPSRSTSRILKLLLSLLLFVIGCRKLDQGMSNITVEKSYRSVDVFVVGVPPCSIRPWVHANRACTFVLIPPKLCCRLGLDAGDPWGFLGILQSSEVMNGTTIWPPALPGFDLNAQNYGEYFRHL